MLSAMDRYLGEEPPFHVIVEQAGLVTELEPAHQPFGWGYSGGGPTALSEALLADALGFEPIEALVIDFESEVVAQLPRPVFELPVTEVFGYWEEFRRRPIFAGEAEAAVVGLLLRGAAIPELAPADFGSETLATTYRRILERRQADEPATQHDLQLDALDGRLGSLPPDAPWAWHDHAPKAPSVQWWADEVHRAALRRRGWRP